MGNEIQWLAVGQWFGGTIFAILTLLGAAKLLENRQARKYQKLDNAEQVHITNQAKQIDADSQFMQSLIKRVENLEREHKEMQNKLLDQAVTTARTEEENKHLKETNERQAQEIKELREDRRQMGLKIVNLENALQMTQSRLDAFMKEINGK